MMFIRKISIPYILSIACAAGCSTGSNRHDEPVEVTAAALDTSVCPPGSNIIVGTEGDDVLVGTPGPDCILGGNGNDALMGGAGDDVIFGENGQDVIDGGDGNDQLDGGNGDDQISGAAGNDILLGGNGDDAVEGGDDNDVLSGDQGVDRLSGGYGDDVIDGVSGVDTISGGDGTDRCAGDDCESSAEPLTRCESDSECLAGQRCAASGLCITCLADAECDDQNACTYESCQPAVECSNPAVPNGTLCLDDTVCNGTETCVEGACTAGTPLTCNAGYFCDAVAGCVNIDECSNGTHNCDPNATCTDTPGSFFCTCNVDYEGDGTSCRRWCTPIVVGSGVERCVRAREDGSVSLHLSRDDKTPWTEEYVEADEPEVNYCGPTAGKNFLFWYGMDVDYATLASEMKTNTWDTALVFTAAAIICGFEPICTVIVGASVSEAAVKAGSLPDDMRRSLYNRAPQDYVLCYEDEVGTLDELRWSLSNGNPVVYLESRGDKNLHWAVVTGLFVTGGETWVRVANSVDRPWSEFEQDWTTSKVGGSALRGALGYLGIGPYIMIRWERPENATPMGDGAYRCP